MPDDTQEVELSLTIARRIAPLIESLAPQLSPAAVNAIVVGTAAAIKQALPSLREQAAAGGEEDAAEEEEFSLTARDRRHLVKASMDAFSYALGLRGGLVVRFTSLTFLRDNWVRLHCAAGGDDGVYGSLQDMTDGKRLPLLCSRGLDVPLAEIVWVADLGK
jgi:hypothetical protein